MWKNALYDSTLMLTQTRKRWGNVGNFWQYKSVWARAGHSWRSEPNNWALTGVTPPDFLSFAFPIFNIGIFPPKCATSMGFISHPGMPCDNNCDLSDVLQCTDRSRRQVKKKGHFKENSSEQKIETWYGQANMYILISTCCSDKGLSEHQCSIQYVW